MKELSVDRSSSLYLGLAITGIVGFFGYFLLADEKSWSSLGAVVIAAAAILLSVMFVWTETRQRPALHIGPNGIRDSVGGLGFIPWEDVESIGLIRTKYPALGVKFHDPAKFGVSEDSFARARRAIAFNGFTPINIFMLKAHSDDVMAAAEHFFQAAKAQRP